jgi:hypothetical protein
MHIEISAGGLGRGITIAKYQLNVSDLLMSTESMNSCSML